MTCSRLQSVRELKCEPRHCAKEMCLTIGWNGTFWISRSTIPYAIHFFFFFLHSIIFWLCEYRRSISISMESTLRLKHNFIEGDHTFSFSNSVSLEGGGEIQRSLPTWNDAWVTELFKDKYQLVMLKLGVRISLFSNTKILPCQLITLFGLQNTSFCKWSWLSLPQIQRKH